MAFLHSVATLYRQSQVPMRNRGSRLTNPDCTHCNLCILSLETVRVKSREPQNVRFVALTRLCLWQGSLGVGLSLLFGEQVMGQDKLVNGNSFSHPCMGG